LEIEVNRVNSTLFEIILKPRKQMVTMRLDPTIILAYEKLAVQLNMKYNNGTRITRTRLMQIILENAVKRPELIEEILVSQNLGDNQ
jgi:spore germination protein YaaH